ncbi:MAG: hypothetical protein JW976_03680, partial [Syntrophaceae bacterium]|nr:hypothetical protein [Syntrophaceae bacterium]
MEQAQKYIYNSLDNDYRGNENPHQLKSKNAKVTPRNCKAISGTKVLGILRIPEGNYNPKFKSNKLFQVLTYYLWFYLFTFDFLLFYTGLTSTRKWSTLSFEVNRCVGILDRKVKIQFALRIFLFLPLFTVM